MVEGLFLNVNLFVFVRFMADSWMWYHVVGRYGKEFHTRRNQFFLISVRKFGSLLDNTGGRLMNAPGKQVGIGLILRKENRIVLKIIRTLGGHQLFRGHGCKVKLM